MRRAAEGQLRRELDAGMTGVTFTAAELDSRLRVRGLPHATRDHTARCRAARSRACWCAWPATARCYWSLNVPVDIHHATDVLVLRRAVGRGEIIRAEDVLVQSRELPGLTSPFVSRDPRISAAA